MMHFEGYRRPDGQVGTRNSCWSSPASAVPRRRPRQWCGASRAPSVLPNIMGCGQMGDDRVMIKRTLVGFGVNPNVSSVLVVGNGCEELSAETVAEGIEPSGKRVEFMTIQEVGGTRKTVILRQMHGKGDAPRGDVAHRSVYPHERVILGTECGGSDFTSGLASNPTLGAAADALCREGGR